MVTNRYNIRSTDDNNFDPIDRTEQVLTDSYGENEIIEGDDFLDQVPEAEMSNADLVARSSPYYQPSFSKGLGVGIKDTGDLALGLGETLFNLAKSMGANPPTPGYVVPDEFEPEINETSYTRFPRLVSEEEEQEMADAGAAGIAGRITGGLASGIGFGQVAAVRNLMYAAPVESAIVNTASKFFANPQMGKTVLGQAIKAGGKVAGYGVGAGTAGVVGDLGYNIAESTNDEGFTDWSEVGERTADSALWSSVFGGGVSLADPTVIKNVKGVITKVNKTANVKAKQAIETNAQQLKELQELEQAEQIRQQRMEQAEQEGLLRKDEVPAQEDDYHLIKSDKASEPEIYRQKEVVGTNNALRKQSTEVDEMFEGVFDPEDGFSAEVEDVLSKKKKPSLQERIGSFFRGAEKAADEKGMTVLTGMPLLKRLQIQHPKVAGRILRHELDTQLRTAKYLDDGDAIFQKLQDRLYDTKEDVFNHRYEEVTDLIFDGKYGEAEQYLRQNDLEDLIPDLQKMRNVLKEIYIEGNKYGLNLRELDNYFPHEVRDYKLYAKAVGGDVQKASTLGKLLELERKRKGAPLSEQERIDIINRHILNRDRDVVDNLGHMGERSHKYIDKNVFVDSGDGKMVSMRDLWHSPRESYQRYVRQMANKIERARLFGMKGEQVVRDRLGTTQEGSGSNAIVQRYVQDYGMTPIEAQQALLIGPQNFAVAGRGPVMVDSNLMDEASYADFGRYNALLRRNDVNETIDGLRENINAEQIDDDSITALVNKLYADGELENTDIDKISKLLKDRFVAGEADLGDGVQGLNTALYLGTLGQIKSTFTQFLDFAPIMARAGIGNTSSALFGKQQMSMKDLGFADSMQEVTDPLARKNWINKKLDDISDTVFKTTKFAQINDKAFNTAINADLKFATKQLQKEKPSRKMLDNIETFNDYFGEQASRKLVNDLKSGNLRSPEVGLYLYQQSTRSRYLSKSQAPTLYNRLGPLGTLLYALQKTALVVGDELYESFMRQARKGKPFTGAKDYANLAMTLGLVGYSKEHITDMFNNIVSELINPGSITERSDSKNREEEMDRIATGIALAVGRDKYFGVTFPRDPGKAVQDSITTLSMTSLGYLSGGGLDLAFRLGKAMDPEKKAKLHKTPLIRNFPLVGQFIYTWGEATEGMDESYSGDASLSRPSLSRPSLSRPSLSRPSLSRPSLNR